MALRTTLKVEWQMRRLFLTFDAEDFISENSIPLLKWVVEQLKKHDLEALFFITGHMAEKLQGFPAVVDLLSEHQIGYHSSSHSVHPAIFEFTDVRDYEQAYRVSLERETAHINALTGEIEGKGGILALRELFHNKQIASFRAPGNCWTPPHLQALRTLGITFDFSTSLSSVPVNFKDITFYPYPALGFKQGKSKEYRLLLTSVLRKSLTILTSHPSLLANKHEWDSIYFESNPKKLSPPPPRSPQETKQLLQNFDLLLSNVAKLQKMQIIETTPHLKTCDRTLNMNKPDVEKCYKTSIRWALKQNYRPKFLPNHFFRFFETDRRTLRAEFKN
jgi:hypothetical protein